MSLIVLMNFKNCFWPLFLKIGFGLFPPIPSPTPSLWLIWIVSIAVSLNSLFFSSYNQLLLLTSMFSLLKLQNSDLSLSTLLLSLFNMSSPSSKLVEHVGTFIVLMILKSAPAWDWLWCIGFLFAVVSMPSNFYLHTDSVYFTLLRDG